LRTDLEKKPSSENLQRRLFYVVLATYPMTSSHRINYL